MKKLLTILLLLTSNAFATRNIVPRTADTGNIGLSTMPWHAVYATKFYGDGSDITGIVLTESDPVFGLSPAYSITATSTSYWNTAYSWGNHAIVGYALATDVIPSSATGTYPLTAAKASELASTPSVCPAGQAPLGIDANGNANGCWTPQAAGDNLGNHIATMTITAGQGVNASTVNVATAYAIGGVEVFKMPNDNITLGNNNKTDDPTNGAANVSIGNFAFKSGTGSGNTLVGQAAGYGYSAPYNYNVGVGIGTLQDGALWHNTAVGAYAGDGTSNLGNVKHSSNTFVGAYSGNGISSGNQNTFIGMKTGEAVTTGSNNVLIGYDIDTPAVNTSDHLNIAGLITGTIGGSSVTVQGDLYATKLYGDGSELTNIPGTTYTADEESLHLEGTVFSALSSSVTLQGNTFNGNSQLVQLEADGKLPAIDGSQLTNLPGGTEVDPVFTAHEAYNITATSTSHWNTAYGWGDWSGQGFLTAETDPVYTASASTNVTNVKIGNWNTAYGWGDHAIAGYASQTQVTSIATSTGVIATGLSTETNNRISADNAIGVTTGTLRADVNAKLPLAGGTMTGDLNFQDGKYANINIATEKIVTDNVSGTYNIDWSAGSIFKLTLTGSTTFYWQNQKSSQSISVLLVQGGTGNYTATFPSTTSWNGGIAPTLSTTTSVVSALAFLYDGSSTFGFGAQGSVSGSSTLDPSTVTLQGNTFNGASQLVQMTSATKLPAVDGSLLTGVLGTDSTKLPLAGGTLSGNLVIANDVTVTGSVQYVGNYVNGTGGTSVPFYQLTRGANQNFTISNETDDVTTNFRMGNAVATALITLKKTSLLVGIGQTSPTYKLDVTGGIRATSTMTASAYYGDGSTLTGLIQSTATGSYPLSISGVAATATKLATARTINGVSFDGTANINIATTSYLADGVSLALTGDTFSAKSSSVTLQGNTFNGNSQLVLLEADGKLPALDGSNLTNLAPDVSYGVAYKVDNFTAYTDGSETDFTLTFTPLTNSLIVTQNGVAKTEGIDYSLTGDVITMNAAPATGTKLIAKYSQLESYTSANIFTTTTTWTATQTFPGFTVNGDLSYNNITPIAQTAYSGDSLTPDCTYSIVFATATAAITINNPTGTKSLGKKFMIRIKDDGTSRAITWGSEYRGSTDVPLLAATVAGKSSYLGFVYNSYDNKWDMIAIANGY